jgi:hypothetical protein
MQGCRTLQALVNRDEMYSSEFNLPGPIDFKAVCGANRVTFPAGIREKEMPVVHCIYLT